MLLGAELGYQYNENLRFGLSLDYLPNISFKDNIVTVYEDVLTAFDEYNFKIKSFSSMFNGYYDIAQINKFTPYIAFGLGFSVNKSSGYYQTEHDDGEKFPKIDIPEYEVANLAYKLGFGSRYNINQKLSLDVRYQFVDLGKIKTGVNEEEEFELDNNGKLKAHQFLLGFVYKF